MKNKIITKEEQKKIEFEILKYVKEICNKNKLNYFLCGGTLLGAVRHKGFIPWDDDIDIMMPYKDYKKLLNLLKKDNNKYTILEPYDNNNYYYTFSKLVDNKTYTDANNLKVEGNGVCIDIFPCNNLPDDYSKCVELVNKFQRKYKAYWRETIQEKYYFSENKIKGIIKAIVFFPEHILYNKQKNKKKIINMLEEYNNRKTKHAGFVASIYNKKEIFDKKIFDEYIELEFEKEKFKCIKQYDEYLKSLYGDYMKLPPEEDRHYPHDSKSYWK